MESYTLYQLNEYIRRVIALNFREPLWIEAEIAQIKESKGNHYVDLIQKDEVTDKVIAQVQAAIWYRNYQFIRKKLGDVIHDLLQDGTEVRIKCRVDFNERYGLKLLIEDIDPRFTYGQLELNRQKIIQKLQDQGLMELNKGIILKPVLQRLAVISSSTAAGYQDFVNQLERNSYGYTYHIDLYDGAVQGANVEADTCQAINQINAKESEYGAVIIIRGGGSKLDLSGYDNFNIAKAIATSPLPFIIGIGHDIDNTVTDMVSNTSVKTPTAVADYLIEHHLRYESHVDHLCKVIHQLSTNVINEEKLRLHSKKERIQSLALQHLTKAGYQLESMDRKVQNSAQQLLLRAENQLSKYALRIEAQDPEAVLSRGYAFLSKGNKNIRSVTDVDIDDEVTIHLKDGTVNSKIIQ